MIPPPLKNILKQLAKHLSLYKIENVEDNYLNNYMPE